MKNKILFLFMLTLLVITVPITALADDDDRASGGGGSEVMVTLHYCDDEDTTVTFNVGYMENMPKSPTKPNYRFTGWYTDKDGGVEVSEYFNRTYDVPKHWYAHWTNVSSFTYTIPADVKIDSKTNKGTINFSGTLDKMKSLNVSITSQNNNKLVNGDQSISYSMDKSSFSYQSEDKSKNVNETVNILVSGGGILAGSYNDKLTFNVSVEQIVTLKSGNVIDIEGKQYTVIEQVNGNQYKVLATDTFDKAFDDNDSNNYATSSIAEYLDREYYTRELVTIGRISEDAIIETSIQQTDLNTYVSTNPTDWGTKTDAGTHKVFVPSWDELAKAAGGTDATTLKTFLNGKYVWLRDTYNYDSCVLYILSNGYLHYKRPSYDYCVRPAFVLDLSKVNFTKVKSGSSDEVTDDTDAIAPVMVEDVETKAEEPVIVEANNNTVTEETSEPKDNETTENTDVVEEPTISEPVINEGTETTIENPVTTKPDTESEPSD